MVGQWTIENAPVTFVFSLTFVIEPQSSYTEGANGISNPALIT